MTRSLTTERSAFTLNNETRDEFIDKVHIGLEKIEIQDPGSGLTVPE